MYFLLSFSEWSKTPTENKYWNCNNGSEWERCLNKGRTPNRVVKGSLGWNSTPQFILERNGSMKSRNRLSFLMVLFSKIITQRIYSKLYNIWILTGYIYRRGTEMKMVRRSIAAFSCQHRPWRVELLKREKVAKWAQEININKTSHSKRGSWHTRGKTAISIKWCFVLTLVKCFCEDYTKRESE